MHVLQFGRYLAVGVISAGIDVLTLWLLLAAQVERVPAVALALLTGMVANYALHRVYTFRSEQPLRLRSVLRYSAIVAANYLLTLAIIEAGLRVGVGVMWGKILSLPVIAMTGFLLTRRFVF